MNFSKKNRTAHNFDDGTEIACVTVRLVSVDFERSEQFVGGYVLDLQV